MMNQITIGNLRETEVTFEQKKRNQKAFQSTWHWTNRINFSLSFYPIIQGTHTHTTHTHTYTHTHSPFIFFLPLSISLSLFLGLFYVGNKQTVAFFHRSYKKAKIQPQNIYFLYNLNSNFFWPKVSNVCLPCFVYFLSYDWFKNQSLNAIVREYPYNMRLFCDCEIDISLFYWKLA